MYKTPRHKYNEQLLIKTWEDEAKLEKDIDAFYSAIIGTIIVICSIVILVVLSGCVAQADEIKASYYSEASLKKEGTWAKSHGVMANGRVFDENALTVATRLYPLGSHLLVTNLDNGKYVMVVVTDRIGKRFAKTRIDLSKGAFLRLGSLKAGLIPVKVVLVKVVV